MPFLVLNAVLALVSIFGGLTLYSELQTTRTDLENTAKQLDTAVREWHLTHEHLVHAQQERDHYLQLWNRYFEMYRKQTKARGRMHDDYKAILERVGIKTLAYADTGEVIEVEVNE